ncbi:MAG TPA: AbrB/MazE/SpoVT family DNA-binding domain-containing protein [Syntrophaceae bacterium]|nr:AbrB/MazE/SpoVT family DNA-binding domain-containing protein [Syntrophaceae bacterium]
MQSLATTKLGERGQVTIPKSFREKKRLRKGDQFAIIEVGDGLMILPLNEVIEGLSRQIQKALGHVSSPELEKALSESRKELYKELYQSGRD